MILFMMSFEPVAKVGYFCTALAVSQAKALRNMHFLRSCCRKTEVLQQPLLFILNH
jgi:hypothetical protein